jgi:Short C-terminal domain
MADTPDRESHRRAAFGRLQRTFPLPITIDDLPLPDGDRLDDDEFVVRTAKDWRVSVKPLILTTRRLICPYDPSSRKIATIPLTDIREVRLRKHWVAFATIVIDTALQRQAAFPAHINGPLIKADIAAMADFAQHRDAPKISVVPPTVSDDRLEQLHRLGELKESGVLSDAEFEREKSRILEQP